MKLRLIKTKQDPYWYQVQKKFLLFWTTIKWIREYEDAMEFIENYKANGNDFILEEYL